MAEYIMKHLVAEEGLQNQFYIESAATSDEEVGHTPHVSVLVLLDRHGINCRGHKARQVTRRDYDRFDLILCMDHRNVRDLLRIIGSDPERKVRLLMDYGYRPDGEIADPWYTLDFEATYRDCLAACKGLIYKLS